MGKEFKPKAPTLHLLSPYRLSIGMVFVKFVSEVQKRTPLRETLSESGS